MTPTSGPQASIASFAYAAPDGAIWLISPGGSGRRRLITKSRGTPSDAAHNAAWSPTGRFLAYGSQDGALRLLDVDSDKETVVDDGSEGLVADFQWSQDGRKIAFIKTKSTPYYSLVGISVASIDGEYWPLADTGDVYSVFWSPDSTQLAYSVPVRSGDPTRGQADVFVVGFDGSSRRKFSDAGGILGWSPDGRLIAYWKDEHGGSALVGDIAVIDVDTGSETNLGAFTSDERPQWAPDPVRHIFHNLLLDTEGGMAVELFGRPGAVLSWSPDASKVAYVEGSPFLAGPRSLVVLDLVASQRTTFHTSQADIGHAASPGYYGEWSPDSRYFAFLAFESDQIAARLYVADTLTGKATPVAGPPSSGEFVSYSPDSQWLLIQVGYNSQAPSLWVTNPDGSGPTKAADGVALIGGPGPAAWRPGTYRPIASLSISQRGSCASAMSC